MRGLLGAAARCLLAAAPAAGADYNLRDDTDAQFRLSNPRTYGVQIKYAW